MFKQYESSMQKQGPTNLVSNASKAASQQSLAAIANFQNTIVRAAGAIGSTVDKIQVNDASTQANEVVANGGDLTNREGTSNADLAYNAIVNRSNLSQISIEYNANMMEAKSTFDTQNDPLAFEVYQQEQQQLALKGITDPNMKARFKTESDSRNARDLSNSNNLHQKKEIQTAFASFNMELTDNRNSILNSARSLDEEGLRASLESGVAKIKEGVDTGLISEADAVKFEAEIKSGIQSQLILGKFENTPTEQLGKFISGISNDDMKNSNPGERDKMIRVLKTMKDRRVKEEVQQVEFQNSVNLGQSNVPLDYSNKSHMEAVETVYQGTFQGKENNPEVLAQKVSYMGKKGVVPKSEISFLKTAMNSNNPELQGNALSLYNAIEANNPILLNQITGDLHDELASKNNLIKAGVPMEEVIENNVLISKEEAKANKDFVMEGISRKDLVSNSNDSLSDLYDTSELNPSMSSEYSMLMDRGIELHGNIEDAKVYADRNIKRKWTNTFDDQGNSSQMPYSPEALLANSDQPVAAITGEKKRTFEELDQMRVGADGLTLSNLYKARTALEKLKGSDLPSYIPGAKSQNFSGQKELDSINDKISNYDVLEYRLVSDKNTPRTKDWLIVATNSDGVQHVVKDDSNSDVRFTVNIADTKEYKAEQEVIEAESAMNNVLNEANAERVRVQTKALSNQTILDRFHH